MNIPEWIQVKCKNCGKEFMVVKAAKKFICPCASLTDTQKYERLKDGWALMPGCDYLFK